MNNEEKQRQARIQDGIRHTMSLFEQKKPTPVTHEWWVFSTALREGWLMLYCEKTGKTGSVRDPSKEEWSAAYYAPSNPYRWHDESRVIIDP